MSSRIAVRCAAALAALGSLGAIGASNLITGDGGRSAAPADLSKLNMARLIYDSEGGMNEAYYDYRGRIWARWETDFPEGDDNFSHRLMQLTRIDVNPVASARMATAQDLGDFPLLYVSDPGYMVLSAQEKAALARYLHNGGFMWADDFWGDAEWQQFADVIRDVLPRYEWRVLPPEHPIVHTVFELDGMPQIPALDFASPNGPTWESANAHKFPTGSMREPQMRAWLDDDGRIMVLATHNTDVGDGWEREAYGDWYFEKFSTKSYMVAVNVVVYAMMH